MGCLDPPPPAAGAPFWAARAPASGWRVGASPTAARSDAAPAPLQGGDGVGADPLRAGRWGHVREHAGGAERAGCAKSGPVVGTTTASDPPRRASASGGQGRTSHMDRARSAPPRASPASPSCPHGHRHLLRVRRVVRVGVIRCGDRRQLLPVRRQRRTVGQASGGRCPRVTPLLAAAPAPRWSSGSGPRGRGPRWRRGLSPGGS